MMGIVSVNARVTAAGIVGDSDDFDVFTHRHCHALGSASRTIQNLRRSIGQLTAEVDRAATQRARFESAHADTLTGLARSLVETIGALDRQRSTAAAGSAPKPAAFRGRSWGASAAPSCRSRWAMQPVSGLSTSNPGSPPSAGVADGSLLEEAERPAAIAALALLQQTQLTDIAAAFAQEVEQAEQDSKALGQRCRHHHGPAAGISTATARVMPQPTAGLSTQLRAAVTILKDFEAERAKLEIVARAVQAHRTCAARPCRGRPGYRGQYGLVSLNAAVRCAQLEPRGASLPVIAMQLRELTTETVVAAEAAMQQL
ncbi:hypothetical protein [Devosia ginsengisoli]|uniref:hypothetical protein n=1 Tax=Devosia ginsengisoli TaxID=400770 RepID=UPI0026EDD950|nr:hypothetical protein [Devosia ginsengisoli]MCR6669920.1 hypothetical protein [Devosia ginsengisoli]